MVDPISSNPVSPVGPLTPSGPARPTGQPAPESSFADTLRRQLEQVSEIQTQAQQGVQDLLSGRNQNITDVFVAARKAEVAFSLLMEIRNKLSDAYTEIKNLRV